jgi:hypothetical protein
LVNPPEVQFCDCGYDRVTRQVDRRRAPPSVPLSGFVQYQLLRLAVGVFACGIAGIALLSFELSEPVPDLRGIVSAILITALSLVLLAFMMRRLWGHHG